MRDLGAFAIFMVSLALASCDEPPADNDDSEASPRACPPSDAPAQLTIENQTANAMAELTMRACDGSDLVTTSIADGGLAAGEQTTVELPSPGCWILSYAGENCFNDPIHQTPSEGVCGGDTHVWTATAQTHSCGGAGW